MSSMYEIAEEGRALYEEWDDLHHRAEDLIERLYVHDEHAADHMSTLILTFNTYANLKRFITDLESLLAPYEEI